MTRAVLLIVVVYSYNSTHAEIGRYPARCIGSYNRLASVPMGRTNSPPSPCSAWHPHRTRRFLVKSIPLQQTPGCSRSSSRPNGVDSVHAAVRSYVHRSHCRALLLTVSCDDCDSQRTEHLMHNSFWILLLFFHKL